MKIGSTKSSSGDRIKILIYGPPGAGKTFSARTLPEKTLLISAESGTLSLNQFDIDMIDISLDENGSILPKEQRFDRLQHVYAYALSDEARSKYNWLFIDSLTEVSQNLVEKLQKEYPDRKDSLVLYGENSKRMRALIKAFRDLPYYNVIFTALSEDDKDENGRRIKNISMVGKISQQVAGYFDEVWYLDTEEDEEGGTQRHFVTQGSDGLVCKDRSGKLEKFEPVDFDLVTKKIRGVHEANS